MDVDKETLSKTLFLDIATELDELILVLDANLNIIFANQVAQAYFGLSDFSAENDFINLCQLNNIKLSIENNCLDHLDENKEFFSIDKNGVSAQKIIWRFKALAKNKNCFYLIGKDITQEEELQSEIDKLQSRLETTIQTIAGNHWWKDLNGVYRGANDAMMETLGIALDDIIGKTDYELPWADTADNLVANDAIIIKNNKTSVNEEDVRHHSGTMMTFMVVKAPLRDGQRNVIGTIGTSIDITELKNTQTQLEIAKDNAEAVNIAKSEFIANMSHDFVTALTGIIGLSDLLIEGQSADKQQEYLENIESWQSYFIATD